LKRKDIKIAQILELLQRVIVQVGIKNAVPNPSAEEHGIKVEFIQTKFNPNLRKIEVHKETNLYKITIEGQSFFCKEVPYYDYKHRYKADGFAESVALNNLRKKIEPLRKRHKVRVVDFVFGFSGKHKLYFVSKWEELPVAKEYHIQLLREKRTEEADRLYDRIHKLIKLLEKDFSDVGAHNMFYDEDKDEIVLFDIFHRIPPQEET
jgi:hypothetical protein